MRRFFLVVAICGLFAMTTAANADQLCWAESGHPGVLVQGGGGTALEVIVPLGAAWTVDVAWICSNPGVGLNATDSVLINDAGSFNDLTTTNLANAAAFLGAANNGTGGPGSPFGDFNGLTLFGSQTGTFGIASGDISGDPQGNMQPQSWGVTMDTGPFGWGEDPFAAPLVSLGPNGPVQAVGNVSLGSNPHIIIRSIPEPGTLGLLILGGIAMIRRSRG